MTSPPPSRQPSTGSANREGTAMVLATDLIIPAGRLHLRGRIDDLTSDAIVVFAHGSGSGMDSPRNRAVAERIYETGCATLLFDLLTPDEVDEDRRGAMHRFDLPLLVERLTAAVDWAASRRDG